MEKHEHQKNHDMIQMYSMLINNIHKKNVLYDKSLYEFIIHNKNIYGTLIALQLSKNFLKINHVSDAIKILKFCLSFVLDKNLKTIIQLRISRLQLEQKNIFFVKNMLNFIKKNDLVNLVEDIQGHLFLLEKNSNLTLYLWKKSLIYQKDEKIKKMIRMKINYISNHKFN